jgi:hypothetical protein
MDREERIALAKDIAAHFRVEIRNPKNREIVAKLQRDQIKALEREDDCRHTEEI